MTAWGGEGTEPPGAAGSQSSNWKQASGAEEKSITLLLPPLQPFSSEPATSRGMLEARAKFLLGLSNLQPLAQKVINVFVAHVVPKKDFSASFKDRNNTSR